MKRKRLFSILLGLALTLGMMFGTTVTANADQDPINYDLWVGNTQVTSANMNDVLANDEANKGKVSFTPASGSTPATLTLDGAAITTTCSYDWHKFAGIYSSLNGGLNIVVESDSSINVPQADHGIYSPSAGLKISGNGVLEVEADNGIDAGGDTTIENAAVTIKGTSIFWPCEGFNIYGKLTIKKSTVTTTDSREGIVAGNIDIEDSIVTARSGGLGINSPGNIDIKGSDTVVTAESTGEPISAITSRTRLDIHDLSVVVPEGGKIGKDSSSAIPDCPSILDEDGKLAHKAVIKFVKTYPLWVGGVQVTEVKKSGNNWSYNPDTKTLRLNGTIKGSGEYSVDSTTFDYGIRCNMSDLTINVMTESTVEGSGTETYSYGILAIGCNLTITGNGKLIAKGGSGETGSGSQGFTIGIKADTVNVDGKLEAIGGLSSKGQSSSQGIEANKINVSGELTATGSGYGIFGSTGGVELKNGSKATITGGSSCVNYGTVKTAINGTAWTDVEGKEGATLIKAGDTGHDLSGFKKVEFPTVIEYPLWVGNVQVTDANMNDVLGNGKVSYTPVSGSTPDTLTLNGAAITKGYKDSKDNEYGIYYAGTDPLTVQLASGTENKVDLGQASFGILASKGDLSFTGAGSLTVKAVYGIYGGKKIVINGGAINTTGSNSGLFSSEEITIGEGASVVSTGKRQAIYGKVKNAIAGTGWTDTAGTQGKADIGVSAEGRSLDYKKVQFLKPAEVTKAPTAKTLTYNGQAQALITTGTAKGGTMQYALGKDTATAPTSGWSASIPTATNAGTYYVWYKVVGDSNHCDTKPACVSSDGKGIEIARAKLTITAGDKVGPEPADITNVGYVINGSITEADKEGLKISLSLGEPTGTDPKVYPIKVSYTPDDNYDIKAVDGKYSVTKESGGSGEPVDPEDPDKPDDPGDPDEPTNYSFYGYSGEYDGYPQGIVIEREGSSDSHDVILSDKKFGSWKEAEKYRDEQEAKGIFYYTYTDVGTYEVYYYIQDGTTFISGSKEVVITPRQMTVTAENKSKAIGKKDPELTYRADRLLEEDADKLTCKLKREEGEAIGSYAIVLDGDLQISDNYTATFREGELTITPPVKAVKKLKKGKKSFTATWKKASKAEKASIDGYQVRYSQSKNFRKSVKTKTVKKKTAAKVRIGKLKAKKTYYVQLRTYKSVGGEKYYSAWSKTKKVKTGK